MVLFSWKVFLCALYCFSRCFVHPRSLTHLREPICTVRVGMTIDVCSCESKKMNEERKMKSSLFWPIENLLQRSALSHNHHHNFSLFLAKFCFAFLPSSVQQGQCLSIKWKSGIHWFFYLDSRKCSKYKKWHTMLLAMDDMPLRGIFCRCTNGVTHLQLTFFC